MRDDDTLPASDADRFFDISRDLLAVIDDEGRIERLNAAWREALGYGDAELLGRQLVSLMHPDDQARARASFREAADGLADGPLEFRLVASSGDVRWLRWSVAHDAESGRTFAAARDVAEARASDEALRGAADRYRELFEAHPVAMAVCDSRDGRILAANQAAMRQYGYRRDEFLSLTFDQVLADGSASPDELPRDRLTLQRHRRKNGSVLEVEVAGHALPFEGRPARVIMAIDVTERQRVEEQLREALKMEAIGRLAGGIAHDFNNLLTAINGYSQLLLGSLPPGDPRREDAEQIHSAGERAAALIGQLLAFSRRQDLHSEVIDLHSVVHAIVPMLSRLVGTRIDLRLELRASTPTVMADEARLEQVLVNLCVNARDSMPEGGTLTIRSSDTVMATPRRLGGELAPAGRYVELRVRDTGTGMDEATRRRVFEPFFTTKERGRGTGLGLAMAYGTVRQSGGHLRATSVPGKGTTFIMLLPLVTDPPAVVDASVAPATDLVPDHKM